MKREMRISLSVFTAYSLIVCFVYNFNFRYRANEIFLYTFPLFLLLLYDFALDKNTFYNALSFCRKTFIKVTLNKVTIEIGKFISETIRDFCRFLWHWLKSIIPGGIIAAGGLYLSTIYHQNWIWNITGTIALILTVILFTYNTRND